MFYYIYITQAYKSSNCEPHLHCYTVYVTLQIITFWKFRMRSCNIGLTYVFHSRQSIYLLIPKCWSKVFSSIENLFLQNDTMSIKFETHLFAASFAIWKRNTQFKIQMQWNESEYKLKMLQTQYKHMNHLILLWETASVQLDHGEFFIYVIAHSVN